MKQARVLAVVVGVLAGGLAGYALGSGPEEPGSRHLPPMRACPPSAWAHGGGYDYAVAGMSCREANRFVLKGRTYQPGAQEGRALRFGEWICFQRSTGPRYSPTLSICANGESRLRFLMG